MKRHDDLIWNATSTSSLEEALKEKGISRNAFIQLYKKQQILVDTQVAKRNAKVSAGQEICIHMPKEHIDYEPIDMALEILFEDEDIIVIQKPSGITMNSKGQVSLANGVASYFRSRGWQKKIRFLNRLDMNTQGCVVVAKNPLAQSFYQEQIESQQFEKYYEALVEGEFVGEGLWELPMSKDPDTYGYRVHEKGKLTKTLYRSIHSGEKESLVEIRLLTGKTHQIRVAFAHAGHPLCGDELYGAKPRECGFFLVAKRIVFTSMRSGKRIEICAK